MPSTALKLLAALADREGRQAAAARLARNLGGTDVLIMVHDPVISAFIPAAGFPASLVDGRNWQGLLQKAAADGEATARLINPYSGECAEAWAMAGERWGFVLLGTGSRPSVAAELEAAMPMLAAIHGAELQATSAHATAILAQQEASRAESLSVAQRRSNQQLQQALAGLKASEQWLSGTLRSIGDAVIATDEHERVIFMNPVSEQLTGWSAEQAQGASLAEVLLIADDLMDRHESEAELARSGAPRALPANGWLERRDGSRIAISYKAAPIRDQRDRLLGRVLVFRDVTQLRHQAEFERRLIGIVSHDLRNPLSAILAAAEFLVLRPNLDESSASMAGRIRTAVLRAQRLINDLMDFTQARHEGGLRAYPTDDHMEGILRGTLDELTIVYPAREIELVTRGDLAGQWDADRVAQAVTNLVRNAVEHGSDDGAITVSAIGEDEVVMVGVHNSGPPIPEEALPRLFDPMQGSSTGLRSGGLGLGLYIVRQIARAHGGDVEVCSSAREGTRFVLVLPRKAAASDSSEAGRERAVGDTQ